MSEAREEPKDFKDGVDKGYEHGINFMLKVRQKIEKMIKNVQPTKEI